MQVVCPVCSELTEAQDVDVTMGTEWTCPRCGSRAPSDEVTRISNDGAADDVQPLLNPSAFSSVSPTLPPWASATTDTSAGLPQVPGYDILGEVARGGMGMVLKGRHRVLNRLAAIKIPLPSQLASASARQRFLREARSAARLNHPHICPIYEVGELAQGLPFIAMGFVHGRTLRDWAKHTPPTARQAAEMVARLARAVGYAHRNGVIHRDIKPGNVMVDAQTGQPILMDFGLAKETAPDPGAALMTQAGQLLGTPAYMAPEQAAGKVDKIGPTSDVYALGALLYDLLCSRPPFLGSVGEILSAVQTQDPVPPSKLAPKVHRDLETICLKALSREQSQRYTSADELAEDLERFAAGEAILARREAVPARLWRKIRKNPLTAASVALVLVALFTAGWLGLQISNARQTATLLTQVDAALAADRWDAQRQKELDGLVSQLRGISPRQADQAQARVDAALAQAVEKGIQRPHLDETEAAEIRTWIDRLAKRGWPRAAALGDGLTNRLREWEPILDFHAPFTDAKAVLLYDRWRPDADAMVSFRNSAGDATTDYTPIGVEQPPDVKVEGALASGWEDGTEAGFRISAEGSVDTASCYEMTLAAAPLRDHDKQRPQSFKSAAQNGSMFLLKVWRMEKGVVSPLVERPVSAAEWGGGPMVLTASRQGNVLSVQLGSLPPLTYRDPFPFYAGNKAMFLVAPHGTRLTRLRAWRRRDASAPTAMEKGDRLYCEHRFAEALDYFRRQTVQVSAPAISQEARFKQAVCLLDLNRYDEALPVLELLAPESGELWPDAAAAYAWWLNMRQERFTEADALLDLLRSRNRSGEAARHLPWDRQLEVLAQCKDMALTSRSGSNGVANAQRWERAEQMFGHADGSIGLSSRTLLDALWDDGRLDEAASVAEDAMGDPVSGRDYDFYILPVHYAWLLHHRDQDREAVYVLNKAKSALASPKTDEFTTGAHLALMVEIACRYAALKDWNSMDRELREFDGAWQDATTKKKIWGVDYYGYWSSVWEIRAFMREDQGDVAGAAEAWHKATIAGWVEANGLDPSTPWGYGSGTTILLRHISESLAGTLTDQDCVLMLDGLGRTYVHTNLTQIAATFPTTRQVLRGMWLTPRGRALARRFVFHDLNSREIIWSPLRLSAYEAIRQMSF